MVEEIRHFVLLEVHLELRLPLWKAHVCDAVNCDAGYFLGLLVSSLLTISYCKRQSRGEILFRRVFKIICFRIWFQRWQHLRLGVRYFFSLPWWSRNTLRLTKLWLRSTLAQIFCTKMRLFDGPISRVWPPILCETIPFWAWLLNTNHLWWKWWLCCFRRFFLVKETCHEFINL